ncbi:MAG TPA: GDSL-type esterase/lipase family protein [Capsulimonadaceae bacterium]|jgi:lysophospholipase L1-like esterase
MTTFRLFALLVIAMSLFTSPAPSFAASGIVRDNDRWVCLGDSITAMNCYPKVLQRVFDHLHPEAKLTVINSGVGGDTASDDPKKLETRVLKYDPTVVSIMYGMNECINSWQPGREQKPILDHYRDCLTYMVRTLRAKNITVLLMSPTLTDPTCHSYFTLEKTVPMLHECAAIMRSVAKTEGAYYIPVQEEFEAFQDSLPAGYSLRADGVHPSALGQYQVARTLWENAGFQLPLGTGKRSLAQAPKAAPVKVSLDSRFAATDAPGLGFTFTTEKPQTIEVTVTGNGPAKTTPVTLAAGATKWTLPYSGTDLAQDGKAGQLIVSVKAGNASSVTIIDVCRTAVLHLVNDAAGGEIKGEKDGAHIANWKVTRSGDDLLFDFDVVNKQFNTEGTWPFSRDGLNMMIDLRPTSRFADIGVDREVYQAFITVREKPFFAATLRQWTGLGLDFTASVGGERTPAGYGAHMLLHDQMSLHQPFGLKGRDFIGFLPAIDDQGERGALTITASQKNDEPVNIYANNLPILDLKNAIKGDSILNVALYTAQ